MVRLMNTSLSPNDTLGRMLHTFSSTGYEIMDNTIDNLKHYGLINLPELKDPQPQKVLKTLDYNWIGNDETKTFTGKGIEKITWVTRYPNSEDIITVDNKTYVNTTSIYTIPDGKEIILTKEILSRGDTITFYYYPEVDLGEALYEAGKYYIFENDAYVLCNDAEFNAQTIYYKLNADKTHQSIKLTNDISLVYALNTFYTKTDGESNTYILSDSAFDSEKTYYKLIEKTDNEFDQFWKLPEPVQYGDKIYKYDTKEYRLAKFKNELSSHFNIEYLATYFIMTEIFECYDSRGKNSMWASWGPKNEGGEYIWYPIFYDIDNQLGINDTGIPSFEYYIDATKDGTYSTNDSVLFNNFYNLFFGDIINKYKQLRGESINAGAGMGTLKYIPLDDINKINNW